MPRRGSRKRDNDFTDAGKRAATICSLKAAQAVTRIQGYPRNGPKCMLAAVTLHRGGLAGKIRKTGYAGCATRNEVKPENLMGAAISVAR